MNKVGGSDMNQQFDPIDMRDTKVERLFFVQEVMIHTYLYMFAVLALSGIVAFATYASGLWFDIVTNSILFYGLLIGEVVIVMIANRVMQKNNVVVSAAMLLVYSVVNGMTLSVIFVLYDLQSIVGIFFVAAAMFGALGIFGLVTKKDLTSIGQIGYMGLFGAIILMIANAFIFKSDGLGLMVSVLVLAVFIGITAYDSQKIKEMARYNDHSSKHTFAMLGALTLYLDFINIFLQLLRLFGKRR